jgi:hypothetical protein
MDEEFAWMPMSASELGALTDKWWELKAERLAADKVAKELKVKESAAEATIIEQLLKQGITSIGGQNIAAALKKSEEPVLSSWPDFWEYVCATKDASLIERRIGRAAIKERWGAEVPVAVPGVTSFPVYKLSKSGVK